jgi:hypothetical protein
MFFKQVEGNCWFCWSFEVLKISTRKQNNINVALVAVKKGNYFA